MPKEAHKKPQKNSTQPRLPVQLDQHRPSDTPSLSGITLTKYLILWQAFIILVTLVAGRLLPIQEQYLGGATQTYLENPLLFSRANFDGNHYISIAQIGYSYAQEAFFPLYPSLIRLFKPYFNHPVMAGVIISSSSFFIAVIFLVKLIRLDFSPPVARWTIIALLFFPTSFFFTSVYTEGLFFLLIVCSFYFARTGRWWFAGIFGALASYARLVGILLFPTLLIEWWFQRNDIRNSKIKIKNLIPLFIIPIGLLIYSFYLLKTTNDPLAFIHSQALFGQLRSEKIILLYQVLWRYIKMVATVDRSDPLYLAIVLEIAAGVVFFIASIYSIIKHRLSYGFFSLSAYLLPTLTGTFVSLPRYVLVCFPAFIVIGQFLSRSDNRLRYMILTSLAIALFIFLSLFVRGYWVA